VEERDGKRPVHQEHDLAGQRQSILDPRRLEPALHPGFKLLFVGQNRVEALGYNELETKRFRIAPKPLFKLALKGRVKR